MRAVCALALGVGFTLLSQHATAQAPRAADYGQPFRPQVHFSPKEHWTNDPNGLVYFHGEYHLFYQYNPFGDVWGHMSWGHAVSKDLLHWNELPVAIPEKDGVMIFTGSIVVDRKNSSGFCLPKAECLVAVYTGYSEVAGGFRQNQNLAWSRDDGRTWTQYAGNPVLDLKLADFRDPSVFWNEQGHDWVMAVSLPKEHKIQFYASPDLKEWTKISEFGPAGDADGDWECPDLLQIPAERAGAKSVWALKVGLNPGAPQGGSGEQYFLGNFDGKSFTATDKRGAHGLTNYGKDDYCAISYNDLPRGEKPTLIGWMSNWQYAAKLPTSPWRGQMSLPRQLSYVEDQYGLALRQEPVTAALRQSAGLKVEVGAGGNEVFRGEPPYELNLTFEEPRQNVFGLRIYSDDEHWTEVGFDRQKSEFYIDRTKSSETVAPEFPARTVAPLVEGRGFDVKLIVDRSSVEAFAQGGTIAMTDLIFPAAGITRAEVFSGSGKAVKVKASSSMLRSIWP